MNFVREGNKRGIVIPPQGHCKRDKESIIGKVQWPERNNFALDMHRHRIA